MISPLRGLSIVTWPLLQLAVVLWLISLVLVIRGLNRKEENVQRKTKWIALALVIGFVPIGLVYIKIGGDVTTKITVHILNKSSSVASNVLVYGTGNIFEDSDTLKLNTFNNGENIEYVTWPNTGPHRNGYIRMEFDIADKHITKDVAGEFSINPYDIQQQWDIIMDSAFIK